MHIDRIMHPVCPPPVDQAHVAREIAAWRAYSRAVHILLFARNEVEREIRIRGNQYVQVRRQRALTALVHAADYLAAQRNSA